MRKITIILFLCILFPKISKAQIFNNMGFKIGYVSSNVLHSIDNETVENFSEPVGSILFSILKEFQFTNQFSFTPYLQYSQKGFNEKWTETNENGIVKEGLAKTKLDYISLIFSIKLKYDNPILIPYLSVGPRIDFLLNEENGIIDLTTGSIKSFWSDKFSKWSFGATVSIGLNYKLTNDLELMLESSYNPDFSDLLRNSSLNNYMKMKNNTFDIAIGIKL